MMFEPVCVITEADESLLGVEDKDPVAPELLVPLRGVRGVFMGSSILS
jgi:hypothetical protein